MRFTATRSWRASRNSARWLVVLALSACTTIAERESTWSHWIIDPRKPATRYSLVGEGARVVRAEAEASVSALIQTVAVDPAERSRIRWRWKAERLIQEANELEAARDDAPARVLVGFSGDLARLEPAERSRLALAGALSGRELPYATLMYIWSSRQPVETVIANPRSSRVRMLVVEQGAARLGRWLAYERDVTADYRRAFGEQPGSIIWIGVMTDADDTGSSALTHYGDIVLER